MEKLIHEIQKLEEQRKNAAPEEQARIDQELETLKEAQKKVEMLNRQVRAGYEKLSGLSDYRNPGVSKEAAEQLESIKKLKREIDEIIGNALNTKVKTTDEDKVLTDEEIDKRIAQIKEELEAIYESAGPSKEELDADPKKREEEQKLLAELMKLNELKKKRTKAKDADKNSDTKRSNGDKKKITEVDYNLLLDLYNQELDKLMDIQVKFKEGKVEFSEVEKVAAELNKKYNYVFERYVIELAKKTGKIPLDKMDELAKITGKSKEELLKSISEQSGKKLEDIQVIGVEPIKTPDATDSTHESDADKPKDKQPTGTDDKPKDGDEVKPLDYKAALVVYKESLKKLKELEEQYKAGTIGYEEYKKHAIVVSKYFKDIVQLYNAERMALIQKIMPPDKVSTYEMMTPEQIDSEMKARKEELFALKNTDPDYDAKRHQLVNILLSLSYEKRALSYKDYTNQDLDKAEQEAIKEIIEIQARVEKGENVEGKEIEDAKKKLMIIRGVKEKRLKSVLHLEKSDLESDITELEDKIKNFKTDGDSKELDALKQQLEELKNAKKIRDAAEQIEKPEEPQFIQEKAKIKTKIKYVAKTGKYQIIDVTDGKSQVLQEIGEGHADIEESRKSARKVLQDDFDKVIGNSKVNYDPVILVIYYSNGGIEAAKKYIEELSKGKEGKTDGLLTEIEYDLDGLKQTKGLSKKQKAEILELATASEGIATISKEQVKPSLWQRFMGLFKKKTQEALPASKPEAKPEAKPVPEKPDIHDTARVEPEDRLNPDPDRRTLNSDRNADGPGRDDKE